VVILVAIALLLALVSSTGYGDQAAVQTAVSRTGFSTDRAAGLSGRAEQERKEVRTLSQVWYTARELYLAGKLAEAKVEFERAVAIYPFDPALRMWAGMAAHRVGDRTAAIRHWQAVWYDEAPLSDAGVWPAVALAAAHLELGQPQQAARFIVPLERGDFGPEAADHPVVSFHAALVYERLATAAPDFLDAVDESLAGIVSPCLASSDAGFLVSPNSRSWLFFLTKRALQRTIRGARSVDWTAPLVLESATVEPSLAPTVAELLEAIGAADFGSKARGKLRALEFFKSQPKRSLEPYDVPESIQRGRLIA
jgi:hypothetical protein